jgi:hypothetical protein
MFTDPAFVYSMLMLSFILSIECGLTRLKSIRRSLKSGNIAKDHDTLGIHVLIRDRHTIVCVCMYGRAVNGSMASQR